MIGKTISHYRITAKLGEGGMGEVYLAEDTELNRKVALKFLPARVAADPDAMDRFKREAQAAAALNHPNIITIHEIGRHEDRSFIVMSYVDGDLLSDELQRGIPLERAIDVATQVCRGLDKAHRAGIVHRDIKPENLLIDRDGRVKILDFGLATSGRAGGDDANESTAGTVYYMSPEQARGEKVDARSDVFSLGAVLYEMLGGKRPFEGPHSEAVRYSILHEEPEPLSRLNPRVTPDLERVVTRALAKDPTRRYPSTANLAADLEAVAPGAAGRRVVPPTVRWLAFAALLLLAITVLVIVNPFKVDNTSRRGTEDGENTVAIMYFDNLAQPDDSDRLAEIITNLLITNLSQSQDLRVVSSQRLYDILKQYGKEGETTIDRSTATEVAMVAGARWMMLGSILQVEPRLVVTSQLVDVATGEVEASQRLTGEPGETVFDVVDRMTGDTRTELRVPAQLDVAAPKPVAEVTTSSLDAYRHFVEGMEYDRRFYNEEACEQFRKALEYDSTFAMAYLYYGWSALSMGRYKEGVAAMGKAARYVDRVSRKERFYIEGANAWIGGRYHDAVRLYERITELYPDDKRAYLELANAQYFAGDFEGALESHRKIIALDPAHKQSYNQLAYIYDQLGNFEKAIWAVNQYIDLAPDEPNPYDTRGDLYAFHGDIDHAIESYQKVLEIKPNFTRTREKIGHMHIFAGRYDRAEAEFGQLARSDQPDVRSRGEFLLAMIPIYRGQLREGLSLLDAAIASDESMGLHNESYTYKMYMRTLVLYDLDRPDLAYDALLGFQNGIWEIFPVFASEFDLVFSDLCATIGRVEVADSVVSTYETVLDTMAQSAVEPYLGAKGMIALAKGDPGLALRYFQRLDDLAPNDYQTQYRLALTYLELDRVDDAIAVMERALARYGPERLFFTDCNVRGYFLLGTAYQRAGRSAEAIEQYQKFVDIWRDADPELSDEVADAKARIERLKSAG